MCDFFFCVGVGWTKSNNDLGRDFFFFACSYYLRQRPLVFKNGIDGRILKGIGIGYGRPGRGNGKEKEMKMRDGERKRRVMIT